MKKFFIISAATILLGCSESMSEYEVRDVQNNRFKSEENLTNHVSLSDVVALVEARSNSTRTDEGSKSDITCFEDEKHDTLLYACNKEGGGWVVYSSDSRVPAIVAESSTGTFAEAMQNEAAHVWMESIAEEMKVIKSLPDKDLNFSAEEIERNKEFWMAVSDPNNFVKKKLGIDGSIGQKGLLTATGHYELSGTITSTVVYDSIPRLTTTNWYQTSPYNMYCPFKSNSTTIHAPAGCVAIAGAQMLYFLHNKFGVPETAPSQAYVYGHVGSNYNWSQYNYTSTVWNTMTTPANAAPLIADVGRRLNTEYWDDESYAVSFHLVNNVFSPYGIYCSYITYNTDSLFTSLHDSGVPVIVSARATQGLGTTNYTFIIDRYKRFCTRTRYCYVWVWDVIPPGAQLPQYPNIYEDEFSSPTSTMIGMNWGMGPSSNDSEWYTLTGDWINHQEFEYYNLNWNILRNMIHNFQISWW